MSLPEGLPGCAYRFNLTEFFRACSPKAPCKLSVHTESPKLRYGNPRYGNPFEAHVYTIRFQGALGQRLFHMAYDLGFGRVCPRLLGLFVQWVLRSWCKLCIGTPGVHVVERPLLHRSRGDISGLISDDVSPRGSSYIMIKG